MERGLLKFVREVLTIVQMAEINRDVVDHMEMKDAVTLILISVILAKARLILVFLSLTLTAFHIFCFLPAFPSKLIAYMASPYIAINK